MDAAGIFNDLFMRAREVDEFEYACALLRIRGMEDVGWDPLEETLALFNDVQSLLGAPLEPYAQMRLGLLLYSHLTEVDAIYRILANMVEVTAGERVVMDPFHDLYRVRGDVMGERYPPSAKRVVDRLKARAQERGCDDLVALFDWFFNDAVRNAFFHSDYVLYEGEFRSREATFVVDGIRTSSMTLDAIVDLVNRGIVFFAEFINVYEAHRGGYREEKRVQGRIGPGNTPEDVILLASEERGLYGFRGTV